MEVLIIGMVVLSYVNSQYTKRLYDSLSDFIKSSNASHYKKVNSLAKNILDLQGEVRIELAKLNEITNNPKIKSDMFLNQE